MGHLWAGQRKPGHARVHRDDKGGGIKGGPAAWGSGYLPAAYQGTIMRAGQPPILDLAPPQGVLRVRQQQTFDLSQKMNSRHCHDRDGDDEFAARIESYELAFRMQSAASELLDLSRETAATKRLYGVGQPQTHDFGVRCLLARLKAKGIEPQSPAERLTLIRRVTIDLTGIPPTVAELDAFLADQSPDAYERLVDRLLTSPAFGERFAQPWLDLARWAETDGFEHDKVRGQAWKYRDWAIDAFNRDLPYDEFVALQLAGDELRPGDDWAQVATGFCLAGPDMPDINLQAELAISYVRSLRSPCRHSQLCAAQFVDHRAASADTAQ